MAKIGVKAAITGCSNRLPQSLEGQMAHLKERLLQMGREALFDAGIYEARSAKLRAESLMKFYDDEEVKDIFDISGGDIANEILPYLDFEKISKSKKTFWGYSDLTTVLNAIYAKTGRASVLYQIRNLVSEEGKEKIKHFCDAGLFAFRYEMAQKESMRGIVVGGNARCLLKLAGTEYWPDMSQKILLLESFHGTEPQMRTYLSQLSQIGVFRQVNGVLLGTFTEMEERGDNPSMVDLLKEFAGEELPIAKTCEIGHGVDAKAIVIGKEIFLEDTNIL